MSYPELNDVWANHLSSFLIPSLVQVRKKRSLVHFEIMHNRDVVRSCWLTNSIARIIRQSCNKEIYLLHVLDNGSVHCVEKL
jgi:hypothetical protein